VGTPTPSRKLVLAGLLLAARNICQAWDFARSLKGDDAALDVAVEKGKKDYSGFELPGRTCGVIGLGAIGVEVANAVQALGMRCWATIRRSPCSAPGSCPPRAAGPVAR